MTDTSEKATVLIIDDELGPRESLRILLKNDHDVLCAESVDAGIPLLAAQAPELVIMDIRMPGKSGIDGLREIRAIDTEVSVIMLTGYGALETAKEALRLGATDYLSKPFDTAEMLRIVRQHTQRTVLERKRTRMLADLKSMNERLCRDLATKERLATLGQSSAEFAHDLRNPLMIVSGYVELLSRQIEKAQEVTGGEYAQATDYLDAIENNLTRCFDLARMWQDLGKAELAGFAETRVTQVVEDLRASIEPMAVTEGVQVDYHVDVEEAAILGSRAQMIRALHNIVANAVHAAADGGGHVSVTCRRTDRHVQAIVEDDGCGMPADVLAQIFTPYFTTKAPDRGTGLGMGITKKIVEEHQGSIDVQSQPDRGTTVTVGLPLLKEMAPCADGQDAPETEAMSMTVANA